MKRILILSLMSCTFFLYSCKTKEEKIADLIKQDMFENLYDFESYQPIETIIDSSFNELVFNDSCLILSIAANKCEEEYEEFQEKINLESEMIGLYSVNSSYERKKILKIYEEVMEVTRNMELLVVKRDSLFRQIRRIDSLNVKEFTGWKVTHKFRCRYQDGRPSVEEFTYLIDNDLSRIEKRIDTGSQDYVNAVAEIMFALQYDMTKLLTAAKESSEKAEHMYNSLKVKFKKLDNISRW